MNNQLIYLILSLVYAFCAIGFSIYAEKSAIRLSFLTKLMMILLWPFIMLLVCTETISDKIKGARK